LSYSLGAIPGNAVYERIRRTVENIGIATAATRGEI
jgi:hypothetical protein